ncbi:MAG: hypothetical protein JWP87_2921 [Labilithrix sp.]|nr:hypothetical protein [Labilithrix sp.]
MRSRLHCLIAIALALGALPALAAACGNDSSTSSAPRPLATGAPVARDGGVDSAPRPDASLPAKTRRFTGTLAATMPTAFGGSPYCDYKITLKQIDVDVTLDEAGRPVSASISDLALEESVPPCTLEPAPPNIHKFSLASSVPLPSGGLHLELSPDPANFPVAALILEGNFASDSVEAALEWHRTDQDAPLDWRVQTTMPLIRR